DLRAPGRLGVWGESAGGQLAALLGLRGGVGAAVCWYPATDLPAIAPALGADPDATDSREALLLGGPVTTLTDAAVSASPARQVPADGATLPAYLLLHGEADRMMPTDQSRRLEAALRAAGGDVSLHTYAGADHMWLGTPDVAADALSRTVAFFRERL
ncbi:MAG: prolyl oligopeptidase family serine peptidase, partial [Nocardioides sp.]|uniref:alpha/beta hydrolase n=1 Tax=Nocardioides sp. TaxID=35761 RepID=UPI0039E6082A